MKYELINALVTPFDDNNQIDFDILKKLIKKAASHAAFNISGEKTLISAEYQNR